MKKVLLFLFFAILALGTISITDFNAEDFLSGALSGLETDTNNEVTTLLQEDAKVQLFFCPQDNCEDMFLQFLDSAKNQVYCALYEIDLEPINEKLLELHDDPDIDFKVVSDDTYKKDFDHEFVIFDRSGFMHNKFCIIDGKKVLTGSANPTTNGMHYNNNNIFIFESEILVQNYLDEFDELYNKEFKKGDTVKNSQVQLETENFGTIDIENYFCPEDNCALHVKETLAKAETSIHFMTFSFTHDAIENVLLIKHDEGKEVKGILEARSTTQYSPWEVFQYQGIEIYKDGNKKTMHHKVFIIDEETVVTGSFNPTASGDERNDENVLIIKNKVIAQLFEEEFERVFNAGKEKALLT